MPTRRKGPGIGIGLHREGTVQQWNQKGQDELLNLSPLNSLILLPCSRDACYYRSEGDVSDILRAVVQQLIRGEVVEDIMTQILSPGTRVCTKF